MSSGRLIVDISLARREFTLEVAFEIAAPLALLGDSGAGKSSVLRAVAGLEPDVAGLVSAGPAVWSSDSRCAPPELRSVGYLPQEATVFPHLTAVDNVAHALSAERVSRRARRERARSRLAVLGLGGVAEARAERLSGGQRRRVALARALVGERAVYLLDEPFSGLDEHSASRAAVLISETLAATGSPALLTGHDVEALGGLCSRSLWIVSGRASSSPARAAVPAAHAHGRAPAPTWGSTVRRPECFQAGSR